MSAYVIDHAPDPTVLDSLLPWRRPFLHGSCCVKELKMDEDATIEVLRNLMNEEVAAGTYPQSELMDRGAFLSYYCSHVVLVARDDNDEVLGSMYIKPNFPGRCGHICNGGLLVAQKWRRQGVGSALARAFELCAKALDYRAAFFNLVFLDNQASLALWKSQGYTQVGRVPNAKIAANGSYVDAAMMYKQFHDD